MIQRIIFICCGIISIRCCHLKFNSGDLCTDHELHRLCGNIFCVITDCVFTFECEVCIQALVFLFKLKSILIVTVFNSPVIFLYCV